jgi:predicted nucleic acid-binding protein
MQFMAAKKIDITRYYPSSSDIFFFDNNVWMYLFYPLGDYNKKRQKHYSSFLQNIQTSRSSIFINSMVLSEFANRYLRIDFDLWKQKTGNFSYEYKKHYVGTTRYTETVEEIKTQIKQIMRCCERASDDFNAIDINRVFQHFQYIDFNDSYYLELAIRSKWKIVTDDEDFITYQNHKLEIVTICN